MAVRKGLDQKDGKNKLDIRIEEKHTVTVRSARVLMAVILHSRQLLSLFSSQSADRELKKRNSWLAFFFFFKLRAIFFTAAKERGRNRRDKTMGRKVLDFRGGTKCETILTSIQNRR